MFSPRAEGMPLEPCWHFLTCIMVLPRFAPVSLICRLSELASLAASMYCTDGPAGTSALLAPSSSPRAT